jgi:hypothetical protein
MQPAQPPLTHAIPSESQHLENGRTLPADDQSAFPGHCRPRVHHDAVRVSDATDAGHCINTRSPDCEPSAAAADRVPAQPSSSRPSPPHDSLRAVDSDVDQATLAAASTPTIEHPSQDANAPTVGKPPELHHTAAVNEAQKQVAYADVILLNKTDLVSESELSAVRKSLKKHNSAAEIIPCFNSHVPLERILNTGAYRGLPASLDVAGTAHSTPEDTCDHCGHPTHDHGDDHHCNHVVEERGAAVASHIRCDTCILSA